MISPELDYQFLTPQRPNSPGSPRLDMLIRGHSGGVEVDHHELALVSLHMASDEDQPEQVTLTHPALYTGKYQVFAGPIMLQMVNADCIEAFTFGGDLQIQSDNNQTTFSVTSPAPILRLGEFNSIPTMLANEAAILLAKKRADELPELDEYNKRLVFTDPLLLYCSCLRTLENKYNNIPNPEMPSWETFLIFLTSEIESLQAAGLWPKKVPGIVELL